MKRPLRPPVPARAVGLLLVATVCGCREEPSPPAPRAAAERAPSADAELAPDPRVDAGGSELERLESEVDALLTRACKQCHVWSTSSLVRMRSTCPPGGPLVVPFAPERSPLYGKISGATVCGGPMPPTGHLRKREIAAVRLWILKGAPVDGTPSTVMVEEETEPVEVDWDRPLN